MQKRILEDLKKETEGWIPYDSGLVPGIEALSLMTGVKKEDIIFIFHVLSRDGCDSYVERIVRKDIYLRDAGGMCGGVTQIPQSFNNVVRHALKVANEHSYIEGLVDEVQRILKESGEKI